jgi:hypothetical protein
MFLPVFLGDGCDDRHDYWRSEVEVTRQRMLVECNGRSIEIKYTSLVFALRLVGSRKFDRFPVPIVHKTAGL